MRPEATQVLALKSSLSSPRHQVAWSVEVTGEKSATVIPECYFLGRNWSDQHPLPFTPRSPEARDVA